MLHDSYQTVPPNTITHSHASNAYSDKQTLPAIVLLGSPNKRSSVLQVSLDLSADMLLDIGPLGLSNILKHDCVLFSDEVLRTPSTNRSKLLSLAEHRPNFVIDPLNSYIDGSDLRSGLHVHVILPHWGKKHRPL